MIARNICHVNILTVLVLVRMARVVLSKWGIVARKRKQGLNAEIEEKRHCVLLGVWGQRCCAPTRERRPRRAPRRSQTLEKGQAHRMERSRVIARLDAERVSIAAR